VVKTPLIDKGEFKAYDLVPVPILIKPDKLVYIRTENSILCIDNTRQYYYFSSEQELKMCKETTPQRYVCKQSKPLLSSLMQDECAVKLLKEWKKLPNDCEVNYIQLTHTVWTQISDNEWIYYVPSKDSITILCNGQDPIDIPLKGAGKLSIEPNCKGYSRAALLQPLRAGKMNTSRAREHRLIQVQLHDECCEELGTRVDLSKLNLNLNFRQTISHAEELKYAGIKVKDLERHILEHEWKEKHSSQHHGYSIVLYIVVSMVFLYIFVRLVLCIKSKGLCRRVAGALKIHSSSDETPRVTGSSNVVNINIKTSNESLALASEDTPLRTLPPSDSKTVEPDARPSRRLRSSRSYF
jgi:nucleoside diphosphate kinase